MFLTFALREGSIIADIILRILKGTTSDVQGLFDVAVKNNKFGDGVILDSIGEVKGSAHKAGKYYLLFCSHLFDLSFIQTLMHLVKSSAFLQYFKSYFKLLLFSVSKGIFQRDLECSDRRGIRHTSLSQRSFR